MRCQWGSCGTDGLSHLVGPEHAAHAHNMHAPLGSTARGVPASPHGAPRRASTAPMKLEDEVPSFQQFQTAHKGHHGRDWERYAEQEQEPAHAASPSPPPLPAAVDVEIAKAWKAPNVDYARRFASANHPRDRFGAKFAS